jgi:hypothetical protein
MTDDSKMLSKISWAVLVGRWNFANDGSVTYLGKKGREREYGTVLSDIHLSGGTIRASFCQQTGLVDGRIMLGCKSDTEEYFAIGLGGYGNAYTLTHFLGPTIGWKKLAGFGENASLELNREYHLEVRLNDNKIELFVDNVRVINYELTSHIPYGQFGLFAWGEEQRKFFNIEVVRNPSDIEHVVVLEQIPMDFTRSLRA